LRYLTIRIFIQSLLLFAELGLVNYYERVQEVRPTPLLQQTAQLLDLITEVTARTGTWPDRDAFARIARETLMAEWSTQPEPQPTSLISDRERRAWDDRLVDDIQEDIARRVGGTYLPRVLS